MNPEGTVYNAMGRINRIGVLCIDAYGVAVKNGFEGTVDEWLASLKGEKGDKGDPGDTQGMTDRTTGRVYNLYMDNGNLMLEEEFMSDGEVIV